MKCPFCHTPGNHQVLESRSTANHIRRRRKCFSCQKTFSTREKFTDATQIKLLRENHRSATKSFRFLAEQNATLWENQMTMISLCRRILRSLKADDSIAGELREIMNSASRKRRI